MKAARTIVKNSFWLIMGEVFSKILTFLLMVFIARMLKVADFGKCNLAQSFVTIFSVVSDLGLNIFLFREIARNEKLLSKYVGNILTMRAILSILYFGILLISLQFFNYEPDVKSLMYLFGGWVCFTNLMNVFKTSFRAMQRMQWDCGINVLDNLFRLAIAYTALNIGFSFMGVGIAYSLGTFLAFCISMFIFIVFFERLSFNFDFSIWRMALKEMRFLALVAILIPLFGRFDTLILAHFKGDEAVGIYSASFKLVWMLIMIPVLIAQAAFSKMSQYAFKEEGKFRTLNSYLLKVNFVITVSVSAIICLLASPIINLIYGIKYVDSVRVLQLLIWCFPLFGLSYVFISGLNANNKQKVNAILIGSILLLNVLLSIILAPRFSYIGVSLATLISLFLLNIILLAYYAKNKYLCWERLRFSLEDFHLIRDVLSKQ